MGAGLTYKETLEFPFCKDFITYKAGDFLVFDFLLCLPTAIFLLFLLIRMRNSIRKLRESESMIMSTYYGFLWGVCLFNIARCVLNYAFPYPEMLFDLLFLISHCVLVFLEVSVVIFMSHGYMVSGREAIQRTALITGIISTIYIVVQAILLYVLNVHLYRVQSGSSALYWFIMSGIFSLVYVTILILPRTPLRDYLPARRSFYYYVIFLCLLYSLKMIGAAFVYFGAEIGYCFVDVQMLAYYTLYAPILYICFMKDFFKEVILPDYYMEMHKSGFFDSDT